MRRLILFFLSVFAFATPAAAQVLEPCCTTPPIATVNFNLADIDQDRPAGSDATPQAASQAPGAASRIEVSGNVTLATGRVFQDQRFVLSEDLVVEASINLAYDGWNLNLWHVESATGRRSRLNRETDVTLSRSWSAGGVSITGQVGVYFIPDISTVYEAKFTLGHPIGRSCQADLSVEIMRGGFEDEVLRGQVRCSREIAPRVTADITPSVSLSNFGGGFSFGGDIGVSYRLNDNLSFRGYAKGYTSGVGSGDVIGISVSITG